MIGKEDLQEEISNLLFSITTKEGHHRLSGTFCFEVAEEIIKLFENYEYKKQSKPKFNVGDVVYFLYNRIAMRSGISAVYNGNVYGINMPVNMFDEGREFIFAGRDLFKSKEALIRAMAAVG